MGKPHGQWRDFGLSVNRGSWGSARFVSASVMKQKDIVNANQQLKFEKDEKISTKSNLMSCNNEPSARREGVLRGRTAFRAGAMNSVPPPKPTSLGTFLFGDKKVPRRRQPCWSYSAQNGKQAIENLCRLPLLFRVLKGSTLDSHCQFGTVPSVGLRRLYIFKFAHL